MSLAATSLPRRAFSIAEVERMVEAGVFDRDEKFELIDGEIVPMSPQRRLHAVLRDRVAKSLEAQLSGGLETYQELTVRVGKSLFEPDVVVAPRQPLTRDYAPIEDMRLVIEVADSSLARDRDVKAPEYAKAGLAELWVLDVEAGQTLCMRQPGPQGYGEVLAIAFSEPLAPLCAPGAALSIAELLR